MDLLYAIKLCVISLYIFEKFFPDWTSKDLSEVYFNILSDFVTGRYIFFLVWT